MAEGVFPIAKTPSLSDRFTRSARYGSELRGHCLILHFAIGQFTGKWEDVVSERNRDILFFEFGMKCIGGR